LSFVQFGLTAAVGVLAGLILAFSLLPILLVRAGDAELSSPRPSRSWSGFLEPLVAGVQRRSGVVLLATLAVGSLSAIGMQLLQIDVSVNSVFGEETRVVQWMRFVREKLHNPDTLEIALRIPKGRTLQDPDTLNRISAASLELTKIDELSAAHSVLDSVSWANRLLHGDSEAFNGPGATSEANAELLLLLSLHDPTILDRWVGLDERHVRVSLEASPGSYRRAARVLAWVDEVIAAHFPGWEAEVTGPVKTYYHMVDEVQRTQLRSFLTAALVVCALVGLFFRSLSWVLAAMVPTLLPILMTLGAMGAWGIYLDMGTAMVAAVVLGIAIDDTVHLLVQYRRRRRRGMDAESAMRAAALHVGRAVVTTSVALSLGFFVLTLSSWASVASFGFLSGLAILGAMAADLIVLPALVVTIARLQQRSALARKLWAT
jgi:predicted RND superfamily exporter protein